MPATTKFSQTVARSLENGLTGGSQSDGWGGSSALKTLGANSALPYMDMDTSPEYSFKDDPSIINNAFSAAPRLVGKGLSKIMSFQDRYYGQNDMNYWMFGYEILPVQVVCFTSIEADPWVGDAPAVGDVYTDGVTSFTYLRTETTRDIDGEESSVFVFSNATDGALPTEPTPPAYETLDGTTNPTYDFRWSFRCQADMFEHVYELDAQGRRFRDYLTAEQITGWSSGDKKNIMMTFGKKFDTYDQVIQNATCKNWSYKIAAGDTAEIECGYIGYNQVRGDYSSADWTLQSGGALSANVPAAHETTFKLGTIFSGPTADMVNLSMKEITVAADFPLDESQSLTSGVWLDVPILNGKYGLTLTGIISRHLVTTYQDMMDDLTSACAQIKSSQGWYMKEYLIKQATVTSAGPDNSPVIMENLNLGIEYNEAANNPFALASYSHLEGFVEVQNSPILLRVRDYNSVNVMFAQ